MTLGQMLEGWADRFRQLGMSNPRSEAELLGAAVLNRPRVEMITQDQVVLSGAQQEQLRQAFARRAAGEPHAYIVGYRDFFKSRFLVGPGALIPRPETEQIVDLALEHFATAEGEFAVADLGAGTGCIGISILLSRPRARLFAVEKSAAARVYLLRNLSRHDVVDRTVVVSDAVEDWRPADTFELIVANPPYIHIADPRVEKAVRDFEPAEALFAAEAGMKAIRSWLKFSAEFLRPGGMVIMEIGADQGPTARAAVESLAELSFERVYSDLAGLDRVLVARRR